METIRNYLESMFAALPNTPEVLRAKQELGAMMEDKFSELMADGRSENEAIGIVISEFGNLEELSEELGLNDVMQAQPADPRPILGLSEARDYIRTREKAFLHIGIGVLLCIISPVGFVIGGFLKSHAWTVFGLAFFFTCVAIGIGLFIYAGLQLAVWKPIRKRSRRIDYATASAMKNDWELSRSGYTLRIIIGVICILLSAVPIIIIGNTLGSAAVSGAFGTSLIFVLIGVGVLLLVSAGGRKGGYRMLFGLNGSGTVGGSYAQSDEFGGAFGDPDISRYTNKTVGRIMTVYWPIVTALYLILSFLTWNWGRTWIIWIIAGIVSAVISRLFESPEKGEYRA